MHVARLALIACLLSVPAAAQPAPPAGKAPPNTIDKLAAYSGTWKTATEHFATDFSKAAKESSSLRNDCWRSGVFYACNQFVDGDSKILLVFTYNAKDDVYTSTQISLDGKAVGSGKLLIAGNVWTFPWESQDDGKTVYFRVVNTWTSPTTIDFRSEFSRDNTTWTVMARGNEQKLP
jgi:hypothetical protein